MNIFKGFGQRNRPDNGRQKQEQFDAQWKEALTKFGVIVGFKSINFNLKHPKTQQPAPPHQALPDIFQEWQQIESSWDRRRLFFQVVYQVIGQDLKSWQIINLSIAIRRPLDALNLVEQAALDNIEPSDSASYYAAFAQTFMALTNYQQALKWAEKANQAEPNNSYFQILLADAFSFNGHCEEANAIYTERMASLNRSSHSSISEMFFQLFARETGVVHSPVFAIIIGESLSDPTQVEEFWQLAEDEFYYSPYFRMQQAYYLTNQGKSEQGFAKLMALVQEMPWLPEANLNLLQYFDRFNESLGKEIMPEFQAEVRQRIKKAGWTTEGMTKID
jgi:tetratricopeptide (TPR) repeat protein